MKKTIIILTIIATLLLTFMPFMMTGCASLGPDIASVQFIAHRGLSAEYYQNTLEAFNKAAESNFFSGIETDVWQTSDGVWVCTHDRDPFEDTTLFIDEITYEVAKSKPLAISKSRGVTLDEDVFICSFEDYLNVCSNNDMIAFVELKDDYSEEALSNLIDQIKSKLTTDKFVIISFFLDNLPIIANIDSDIEVQALVSNEEDTLDAIERGYSIGIYRKVLNRQIAKMAKEKKLLINVWTINKERLAKKYIRMGVNFITTDKILKL